MNENNTLQLLAALDREDISSYDIIVTVTNTAPCYLSGIQSLQRSQFVSG